MHPVSRLRMETHLAFIRLTESKEFPGGFRVLSAQAISIVKPSRSNHEIFPRATGQPSNRASFVVLLYFKWKRLMPIHEAELNAKSYGYI
jgi:hypothetical protein